MAEKRRGGFSKSQRTWIKNRDGNSCVMCSSQEQLECHHITPFRYALVVLKWPIDLVNSPNNCVTLCHACHQVGTESIHPDIAIAHKVYREDKHAYSRVFAERDAICRTGAIYHFSGHDLWFRQIAEKASLRYLAESGVPFPWSELH